MKRNTAFLIIGLLAVVVVYHAIKCKNTPENGFRKFEKSFKTTEMSNSEMSDSFALKRMASLFKSCVEIDDPEKVDLDCYITAWIELIKFLKTLGTAMGFVASDVEGKMKHMRMLKDGEPAGYKNVASMITHEKNNDLIQYKGDKAKPVLSGSRTIQRLHRALIFLQIFFKKVGENPDDESAKVSTMCHDAYKESPMSKYHSWMIRKSVGIAVMVLPSKKQFILQLGGGMENDELYSTLDESVKNMNILINYTETLFKKNDIMELP